MGDRMPVRWGFLGAGSIAASSLAPAVHRAAGAVLHRAAARDPARAAALGPVAVRAGYPELIADPEVEAVYVALHNSAHLEWTAAALAAGKHVLCEKPLALSVAEVDRLTVAAERAGRLLVEAVWNRWHPRTREAERLVAAGAVGPVSRVTSRFCGRRPAPGDYRIDPRLGGGALADLGCYAVAAALWAFGWQQPTEVRTWSRRWPEGADWITEADLRFAGGGVAEVLAGFTGISDEVVTIQGSAATLRLEQPAFSAGVREAVLVCRPAGAGSDRNTLRWPALDPYRLMIEEMSRAIRGEPAYVVPLAQSRAVAAVLDRIGSASVAAAG